MSRITFRAPNAPLNKAFAGGLLLAVSLAGCTGTSDAETPSSTTTRSSTAASMPTGDAALEPGTYLVRRSASASVDYTVTFPEGWRVQDGEAYSKHADQPAEIGFAPFVVDKIYADACQGERGAQTQVGPGVDGLVSALLEQPGPAKSGPVETMLGGYPATRVDLRVPRRLQSEDCFMGPGTGVQIWHSEPDDYLVLDPAGILSIHVVDVDGERQVFTSQYRPAHASEDDQAELQQVLDSIHIEQ